MKRLNALVRTTLLAFVLSTLCILCPSVIAQAPGELQQGSINTSASNIKNTSRVDPSIDRLKVELAYLKNARTITQQGGGGGPEWLSRAVSIKNDEFDLGFLQEGEYELRFSDTENGATANRGITIATSHVEYSNQKAAGNVDPKHNSNVVPLTVTLTGVVDGPLKQELQAQLNGVAGELSRPGKTKFKNIVLKFKADGRSQVKGMLKQNVSIPR